MDIGATVRAALIKCLTKIQSSSGHTISSLSDDIRPLEDLEDFDSEVWPIASGMLQAELGMRIPGKINIFRDPVTHQARSIAQIVKHVAANHAAWAVTAPDAAAV